MKTSLENLKPFLQCAACQHKHELAKAVLVEERDDQTTLHITCASCGVSAIVFVSMTPMGVMSMGALTDLESDEARNLYGRAPVSIDQILDMRAFLREFKGGVGEFVSAGTPVFTGDTSK